MIIIIDEILKTYYGFSSFYISKNDSCDIIKVQEDVFFLYKVNSFDSVKRSYELSLLVDYCNDFVWNRFGEVITTVQDTSYVLFYSSFHKKKDLPIFSFYSGRKKIFLNWRNLWIEKSNYMEYFLNSIRGKFPIIDESLPYYLGLLETGIYLLKDYENYYADAYIEHQKMGKEEYYNPLNLMLDVKERDFAEYLKYLFFNNLYQEINISELIQKGGNIFDYNLVIARLFLPNYYFSVVDDIILEKVDSSQLKKIIVRSREYEDYVEQIILEIEKIYPIKKHPSLK